MGRGTGKKQDASSPWNEMLAAVCGCSCVTHRQYQKDFFDVSNNPEQKPRERKKSNDMSPTTQGIESSSNDGSPVAPFPVTKASDVFAAAAAALEREDRHQEVNVFSKISNLK